MKEVNENRTDAETRAEKVEMLQSATTVSIPGLARYTSITIPVKKLESLTLGDLDGVRVFKEYGTVRAVQIEMDY